MRTITKEKRLALAMILVGSLGLRAQERTIALSQAKDPVSFTVEENSEKGGNISTYTTTFVEMTKPTGGYKCIVDMAVFNGRLYLSTADDPLGNWGAKVFYTTDATSYTSALSDASSQGYLRMGVFDNQLFIPDGDPNGMDPGYCYISSTGNSGSFNKTTITGAVHTFDVIKYSSKMYVANGMATSLGGMCEFNGSNLWSSVNQPSGSFRMKYMAECNGKLFVANANPNSDVDYFLYSGSASSTPQAVNKFSGSASTYQIYTTSQGKMFWTVVYSGAIHVVTSTDGINWTPSPSLDGKFVSDFAELNGKLYAIEWKGGLWESSDHNTFTAIASPPSNSVDAFGPLPAAPSGYNADARASIAAYNGALYCGSSTTGKVYKVTIQSTTAASEIAAPAMHCQATNHSVILDLQNNATVGIKVYSIHGAVIKNVSCGQLNAGRNEINLDELKDGIYLIETTVGTETQGVKFVRSH
jgi:hypothetical protein